MGYIAKVHCFPLQVLTGCVASCEDHGYVIDIGVKGVSAFLNTSEAEKYSSACGDGMLYRFAVGAQNCVFAA